MTYDRPTTSNDKPLERNAAKIVSLVQSTWIHERNTYTFNMPEALEVLPNSKKRGLRPSDDFSLMIL